jgi:hypothetical protein
MAGWMDGGIQQQGAFGVFGQQPHLGPRLALGHQQFDLRRDIHAQQHHGARTPQSMRTLRSSTIRRCSF